MSCLYISLLLSLADIPCANALCRWAPESGCRLMYRRDGVLCEQRCVSRRNFVSARLLGSYYENDTLPPSSRFKGASRALSECAGLKRSAHGDVSGALDSGNRWLSDVHIFVIQHRGSVR